MKATERARTQSARRITWSEQQSREWYRVASMVFGVFLRLWVRRYLSMGVDNVPETGSAFLVANHSSYLDPFLLSYPIGRRLPTGPGKAYLFTNPAVAYLMRKIGIFPIRQDVQDTSAVRAMVELYRKGRVVIVFPEGGRSVSGELRPFFPEFARLAIRLKANIIPAGIAGASDLLPVGGYFPHPGTPVMVGYGPPFDLSEFYQLPLTDELAREAAEVLRQRVAHELAVARDANKRR